MDEFALWFMQQLYGMALLAIAGYIIGLLHKKRRAPLYAVTSALCGLLGVLMVIIALDHYKDT